MFIPTPPISTYLIAFIVSDLPHISSNKLGKRETPFKIYAQPSKINETYLALEASEKILHAFEIYLRTPFSLPKMDEIAVPDFAFGAMENWGLVTYRSEFTLGCSL